jgi:hypothetical protein
LAGTGSGALTQGRDRTSVGCRENGGAALPPTIATPRVDAAASPREQQLPVYSATGTTALAALSRERSFGEKRQISGSDPKAVVEDARYLLSGRNVFQAGTLTIS